MTAGRLCGRSVAVIGGGIGGLAAALSLARRGAKVTVHEQAPELREVGAGIQIAPNGARVLDALGLGAECDRLGLRSIAVEPVDAISGRAITRFDLTALSGPPYRFFHRADLIDMLAAACRAAGVVLRTGTRIEKVGEDGRFEAGGMPVAPDLTIGADGLHSRLRVALNGADAPRFTGQVAWRAVIALPDAPPVARIWMAPRRHLVTYPLRGGRLNIVAVQERREWAAEGWHHAADPATLRAAFAGLSADLTGLLERVEAVRLWGLFLHPVARRWHGSRTALLGDAAHPTLPFLAQGANLALEDAWALAACCDAAPLSQALPAYQTLRRGRVIRAVRAANANAVNYHLSGPRRALSHTVLAGIGRLAPGAWLGRMDWLYGYDVTAGGCSR